MGYTHYFRNKRAFTNTEWRALTADVKKLFKNCGVPLANAMGEKGTSPEFTKDYIQFCGVGDDGHETASVTKEEKEFEFCKTARKPYDKVVVEFYKLIRKYDPDVQLSSDGGDEVFNGVKIKVNNKWTYCAGDFNVKVGDTVILPPNPYNQNNWEGVVTAIGSSYDGPLKKIVGVKQEVVEEQPLTLEDKITEFLCYEFSLNESSATAGAMEIVNIVTKHLRS